MVEHQALEQASTAPSTFLTTVESTLEPTTVYALETVDIRKSFFKNDVLKGISFGIKKGEVLGLVGANGAGKSTLMKIINGVYKFDSGSIKINGQTVNYKDAQDARKCGIAMVYQDFSLIPTMTVAQNLFLAAEPKKGFFIDDLSCLEQAKNAFLDFNVAIDPTQEVHTLSIGDQQIVEIIKALLQKPAVLILDEPTASLTAREITMLFEFINKLRKQGIAIILITHHLQEIKDICDKVLVLRDGNVVLDERVETLTLPEIIQAIIGRKVSAGEYLAPKNKITRTSPLLTVSHLTWQEKVKDVSFTIYPGEIVGIAGLLGSGRTEIIKNIFGLSAPDTGEIVIKGRPIKIGSPADSIKSGLFLVPENRRKSGIVAGQSIKMNILLPIWNRLKKGSFIDEKKSDDMTMDMMKKLQVKAVDMEQYIERLSGGNQQKVVFAKSLVTDPAVLLLDDPTVGIDIEAKNEIANLIRKITDEGNGVLLVSSEMEELARLSDRVFILKQGVFVGEFSREQGHIITEESLTEAIQTV